MGVTGEAGGAGEHATVAMDRNGGRHLRRLRSDAGWSDPEQREVFLTHLIMTCNVTGAAAKLGLRTWGAYKWRNKDPEFRARWDAAIEEGRQRLWGELLAEASRSLKPLPVPDGDAPPADTVLAIALLKLHRESVVQPGGSKRRHRAPVSADELRAIIFTKLQEKRKELTGDGG